MVILRIEHPVSDFDTWCVAFARFAEERARAGVRRHAVRRPVGEAARISVDLTFDDEQHATAFERFLRERVWASPALSPALAGAPVTSLFREEEVG